MSIGARVNELTKINQAIAIVDDKTNQLLNHTRNKI